MPGTIKVNNSETSKINREKLLNGLFKIGKGLAILLLVGSVYAIMLSIPFFHLLWVLLAVVSVIFLAPKAIKPLLSYVKNSISDGVKEIKEAFNEPTEVTSQVDNRNQNQLNGSESFQQQNAESQSSFINVIALFLSWIPNKVKDFFTPPEHSIQMVEIPDEENSYSRASISSGSFCTNTNTNTNESRGSLAFITYSAETCEEVSKPNIAFLIEYFKQVAKTAETYLGELKNSITSSVKQVQGFFDGSFSKDKSSTEVGMTEIKSLAP